jgi:hypothetical protein
MKKEEVERYRARWKQEVERLAASGWYTDEGRADRIFKTLIAPLWKSCLGLGNIESKDVAKALGITPNMQLMLMFFGVGVLRSKVFSRFQGPRLAKDVWPPYLHDGGLFFVPAVPKCDIARIIGKKQSSVDSAIDRLRGSGARSKIGNRLVDMKLAFFAPFATGIMFDGGFDAQLSLPYVWKAYEYEQLCGYAFNQRQASGRIWNQTHDWARTAKDALVGSLPCAEANLIPLRKPNTGTDWK